MTIKTQANKRKPTLKIYRTDGVQPGWENRIDSTTSSTYLLHEEMDYSQNRIIPKIGERMGESKRLPDGKIYHHESDWLIAKIQRYPALNEECDWDEIILCYCKFERIESKWERVPTLQELIANEVAKE